MKESILSACAVYVAQKDKLIAEEKKKVDAAKKEVNNAEKDLQGVKKSVADADKKFQEVCGFEPHLIARALHGSTLWETWNAQDPESCTDEGPKPTNTDIST